MIKCSCGCEFEPEIQYRHRLACGDCADRVVVMGVTEGEKADACVTDFPYNIGKDYGIWNDKLPKATFWEQVIPSWLEMISKVLTQPAHFITTFSERGLVSLVRRAQDLGFQHRHTGVWHNPNRKAGSYPGQWPFAWEPILDFSWGGWRKLNNSNSVGYLDVWVLESPIGHKIEAAYHPAEKPVKLYYDLVGLVTDNGQVVYEPFCGSGTTLVVCENLNRKCRAIEISPAYCSVALERMSQMGLAVELIGEV